MTQAAVDEAKKKRDAKIKALADVKAAKGKGRGTGNP